MGWSGLNVSAWLVVALRGARPAQPARPRRLAQTPPELGVYSPKKHGGALYCNAVASFRSQLTSVTPTARIASATGVPCATSTSAWRSLETISSGVCLFLRIVILRLALVSHTSGRTTSKGADHRPQAQRGVNAKTLRQALENWGSCDILVNNAGIQHTVPLAEATRDVWD